MKIKSSDSGLVSIGVLSRETGIHSSTIRVWESRYGAIEPARTAGGARRYAEVDVQRLKWMKALVDAGRKPSALARLSLDELKAEFMRFHAGVDSPGAAERVYQIGVFADADWIGASVFDPPSQQTLEIRFAGAVPEVEQKAAEYDVVVVFIRGLQLSMAERIAALSMRLNHRSLLVVYEFSNTSALAPLKDRGIESLRYPVAEEDLLQVIERLSRERAVSRTHTVPHFSIPELQSIQVADNKVMCECPKHLASLLISLHGFIDYTTQCADESPAEALIHQRLRDFVMASVSELESGLQFVLGVPAGSGT